MTYTINANDLQALVKITDSDETRPVLQCIHIRKDGWAETADGFRLLRAKGEGAVPASMAGTLFNVREKTPAVAMWTAFLRTLKGRPIDIARDANMVVFTGSLPVKKNGKPAPVEDWPRYECRLPVVDGKFPPSDHLFTNRLVPAPKARIAVNGGLLRDIVALANGDHGAAILRLGLWEEREQAEFSVKPDDGRELRGLIMPMFCDWNDMEPRPDPTADKAQADLEKARVAEEKKKATTFKRGTKAKAS